jgi:hypothetical protein
MIKFLRKMALIDTHALGLKHKDIIFNKINELNQDFHFMKFKVISEGEFSHLSEKKQESEEFYNYVKKVEIRHVSSALWLVPISPSIQL